jgi:glutamate decarboxylase
VYPGVGWVIWRDADALPEELIFDVNYLGGHMPTFSLNFSRPGSEVVAQYFMFASLGFDGFKGVQQHSCAVARYLADSIADIGPYQLVSSGRDLPVFSFALKPGVGNYSVFEVSERLREKGWLVPAYTYPANRQDLAVLRVVVRSGMSFDMADSLLEDLRAKTAELEALPSPLPQYLRSTTRAFSH